MISSQQNQLIIMNANKRTLKQPYGLYRNRFLTQLFSEAYERKIINTGKNLTDYVTILGPRSIKLFKPEMWTAIEELRINREAIAAGLLEIPPNIIAPIEANGNLPLALPSHTALQPNATANQVAVWKINAEITNDFVKAKAEFKDSLMNSIPSDIYKTLELKGGTKGWAVIEPNDVFELILSDAHASVPADTLRNAIESISKLWARNIPLRTNIEAMKETNLIIGASFPHLAKSDQELFRIAHDIAILPQYDLATTVDDFMRPDNQSYQTSLFSEFSEYLIVKYTDRRKLPDRGHLAFIDEGRYIESPYRVAMVVGTAAEISNPTESVALAAKTSERHITDADWADFQDFQKKREAAKQKVPVVGKLCFLHGWSRSHDSTQCTVMKNDPKFTAAQKAFVRIPKNKNLIVDGVQCSTKCYTGVVPAP